MKTGEGKTLVATLPVYLNALAGKGVHVVTVNDYLARRDAEWMGAIYRFLGLTVGVHPARHVRRRAHARPTPRDITYGTNNEFGFDYLRDNMKFALESDGPARPPLRDRRRGRLDPDRRGADAADHLRPVRGVDRQVLPHRPIVPRLARGEEIEHDDGSKSTTGDFLVDEKAHTVTLTDDGVSQGREAARRRQPLRPGEHGAAPRHQPGAARPPPRTSATSTTWSRTARSSSSTSSPAA